MHETDVLVDSDAFVGFFFEHDAHFEEATRRFQRLADVHARLVVSSFVVMETATVLSRVSGQPAAQRFLQMTNSGKFLIVHIDEALQKASLALFQEQPIKNVSVVDCANVVLLRQFGIPQLFSFDKFYHRFELDLVS